MGSDSVSLVNQLMRRLPPGAVATQPWLTAQGVYQQLADKYVRTAWLTRLGRGVYKRAGDRVDWTGGLYALQSQLRLPVHAAAKTALDLQGYGHFLPMGRGAPVYLFGGKGARLPAWFHKADWGVGLNFFAARLLTGEPGTGLTTRRMRASGMEPLVLTVAEPRESYAAADGFEITLSAPERAMLETCYLVPRHQSFEEARLLMEGLTSLRPALVQTLLERCTSFSAKRVFLYLAEVCGHRWLEQVRLNQVDLGRGKRMLVRDGRYDAKFRITVPREAGG